MLPEELQLSTNSDRIHNEVNNQTKRICSRSSTAELKRWLMEHQNNPYPTKTEKVYLAKLANLSLTQVSTWFANARRRLKKEPRIAICPSDWLTAASLCYCNGLTTTYQTPFDSYSYSQRLQYLLYNSRLLSYATNEHIRSYNVTCNTTTYPDAGGGQRKDDERNTKPEMTSNENAERNKKKIWSVEDMIGPIT